MYFCQETKKKWYFTKYSKTCLMWL